MLGPDDELTGSAFELGIHLLGRGSSLAPWWVWLESEWKSRHFVSVLWLCRTESASHCAPGRCPATSESISACGTGVP